MSTDPHHPPYTAVLEEPGAGPVITVFRSRHRPEAAADYEPTAIRMYTLASAMPGFVDFKSFTADDGEQVSIVTFADEVSQRAWREHPEHREAQQAGRDHFYQEYSIQVCRLLHARSFVADAPA